jgi:hypothetical protein
MAARILEICDAVVAKLIADTPGLAVRRDAAGNVLQAALYLACAADYGIEV